MKYDAILETILPDNLSDAAGRCFVGNVFEDAATHGNHPFRDGTQVQTTAVSQVVIEVSGIYLVTRNTTYKVRHYQPRCYDALTSQGV